MPSYSEVAAATPAVKAQTEVRAKLYGHDDIHVSWRKQTVKGATVRYRVEYKRSTWSKYRVLSSKTTRNYYKKPDLVDGAAYKFKVTPYVIKNGKRYSGRPGYSSYIYTLKKISTSEQLKDYGVFLGINEDESEKLKDYKLVVIEPSEFSVQKVQELKAAGKKVYGYLNIGSIEEYRPYYERFEHLTLGVYEDWPDERWIDISAPEWQSFIIDELGKQYAEMGFDGFFLDNADIYYIKQTEDIYQGLGAILTGLKKYNIVLIINGGDTFVSRSVEEDTAGSMFDGVNQETVFTKINFDDHTYGEQDPEETQYFKEYLADVKDYGLMVYLLEYGADRTTANKIGDYCTRNGFIWYNAKSLELD
ncbi:MAG TPA: hypothetical protein GX736_06090 [Mogibacterium sp.]|nr:hypothetical protein [Mogibacterium sp.]